MVLCIVLTLGSPYWSYFELQVFVSDREQLYVSELQKAHKCAIILYMTTPAISERAELDYYTQRNANLLVHDEVLSETSKYEHNKDYIYWSIGKMACNLVEVGEDEAAQHLVEELLQAVNADEDATLRTWSSVAENGSQIADTKLRQAMQLDRDNDGKTVVDGQLDIEDGRTFRRLFSLYKFGDNSLLPYLHQYVETIDDEATKHGVHSAVELYEAGDESAYDLIKTTAKKALTYAISQKTDDKELSADDASDFTQLINSISSALLPSRSDMERLYSQADIALKYFAQSLLKKGDIRRADEIQSLLLSGFDNAWLSAQRFEMGHDADGQQLRAAKDYLAVYGDDSGSHILEITNALVRGGDPEAIAEYEAVYDQSIDPKQVDYSTAADMLVALHLSGDGRAHDRLIELLIDPEDIWQLIYSLESMGLKDEAIDIAQTEFAKQPDYNTGLTLLNLRYDPDAMRAVQTGASEHTGVLIEVVNSRARHLGKLAAHINELEHGSNY